MELDNFRERLAQEERFSPVLNFGLDETVYMQIAHFDN